MIEHRESRNRFVNESGSSDANSEPEISDFVQRCNGGKKRSCTSGSTQQGASKRSRISRVRRSVDDIMASLNGEDEIFSNAAPPVTPSNENSQTVDTVQQARSAPSSRGSNKTPARKGKTATSLSEPVSRGRSTISRPSAQDETPRRKPTEMSETQDQSSDDYNDNFLQSPHAVDGHNSSRSSSPTPPEHPSVCTALKEITSLLNTVVKRIDRMENELKRRSTSDQTSSTSASEKSKKKTVPLLVKSEVRKTYKMLLEDEENDFEGFNFDPSVPFNAPTNETIVARLVKEVIANNPQFQGCDIRAAARTYYRTKSQERSLKERGKYEERGRARRRCERLLWKYQKRSSIFQKSDMPPKSKEKWSKVLLSEVMSSEESGTEEDDIFVKPLPWRSDLVNKFFAELDERSTERKTPQALRQRKNRIMSVHASTRRAPPGLPKWAIKV